MLPTKRSVKEKNYLKKIYLVYGQPKSGKTTIASKFGDDKDNKVLFFATEPGHKFQEIYKWQKPYKDTVQDPDCWEDFLQCCRELVVEEHDFKCLVVDVVDILWKWVAEYICKEHGITHIKHLDYGEGYDLAKQELMKPINFLAQKGMGMVFVSHEQEKERTVGPRKISYIDSSMPNSAKKVLHGICDYILYFHTDSEGHRYIRTKPTENVNAGDRSGILPSMIEMNHEVLIKELKKDTAGAGYLTTKIEENK